MGVQAANARRVRNRAGVAMRRLPVVLGLTLACSDGPTIPTRDLSLTICNVTASLWIAYQNENSEWTRLDLSGAEPGTISVNFKVTERMAVARSDLSPAAPAISILYGTADQVREFLACKIPSSHATRTLSGSVSGIGENDFAVVTIGPSMNWYYVSQSPFELGFAAAGTRDVFAARYIDTMYVDRAIVRRGQAHSDGVIPLLDFESSEAVATQQNMLTWTPAGAVEYILGEFHGADGNNPVLRTPRLPSMSPTSAAIFSLPASRLVAGDLHEITISGSNRSGQRFYYEPADQTLALGPVLSQPTFTPRADSPHLSLDVDIPSQTQYDGYVEMTVSQSAYVPQGPRISITVTREYFGELPASWSVKVPNFSGVSGFETWMGLDHSKPYDWSATATSRRWSGPRPSAGDQILTAYASGSSQ
jgi:hypothetical protein